MLDGKGMYQGLLISVLSSCLKTAQQVYSWAHLLLSLCFFSNLNIHPSVDTNPKEFSIKTMRIVKRYLLRVKYHSDHHEGKSPRMPLRNSHPNRNPTGMVFSLKSLQWESKWPNHKKELGEDYWELSDPEGTWGSCHACGSHFEHQWLLSGRLSADGEAWLIAWEITRLIVVTFFFAAFLSSES